MKTQNRAIIGHPEGDQPTVEARSAIADTFAGPVHIEWDATASVMPLGQLPFFIGYPKQAGLFDARVTGCPLSITTPPSRARPPKRPLDHPGPARRPALLRGDKSWGDRPKHGGSGRSPKRTAGPARRDGIIAAERSIHGGGPYFQHQMGAPRRPAHLLLSIHSPMQQPLHRALCDRRRNRFFAAAGCRAIDNDVGLSSCRVALAPAGMLRGARLPSFAETVCTRCRSAVADSLF
jgi:hypothetical protein